MFPNIAGVNYESIADGIGVRTAIYLSGCEHQCLGCHNPETWDVEYGSPCSLSVIGEIAEQIIRRDRLLSGITLTGGDPFYDPEKTYSFLACLLSALQKDNYVFKGDLWVYTGYTFEELMERKLKEPDIMSILLNANVLVDGRFVLSERDITLPFRGSANQRLINVPRSLVANKAVLL